MKIFFPPELKRKLDAIIQLSDIEVSVLGKVKKLPNRSDFIVTALELFEQECSEAHTELDADALGKFFSQLLERREGLEEWRLWVHSHVDFKVFFSSIDERTIRSFLGDWLISICLNRHGDYVARLDIYKPVHVTCEDLQIDVWLEPDPALLDEVKAELEVKVHKKPIPFYDYGDYPWPPVRRHWSWGERSWEEILDEEE